MTILSRVSEISKTVIGPTVSYTVIIWCEFRIVALAFWAEKV